MKRLFLVASFSILSTVAMAQWSVQAQYNLWIPTGNYNSELKIGYIGVGVEAKYSLDDYINGTIGAGYANIGYKTVLVDRVQKPVEDISSGGSLQIIPITIGADVYFNKDKFRPYLDMDFGAALVNQVGDGMPDTEMKINPFLSPGFGVEYEVTDGIKLQGVVKQHILLYNYDNRPQYLETFTAVGINLGLTYRF